MALRQGLVREDRAGRRSTGRAATGGEGGTGAADGFEAEISSIAVSSAPPSGSVVGAGATLFCIGTVVVVIVDCCASAGSARTTAADAIRMALARIASGRGHGDLDRVGRLLLRQPRQEEQGAEDAQDDNQDQS